MRYVDDIILFGKNFDELIEMRSLLKDELSNVGLEMHALKTKKLSNHMQIHYHFWDIGDMMIEVLGSENNHN